MSDRSADSRVSEHYLGDGLYCRLDGCGMVILRAPRDDGDDWVALEPGVLAEFERWVKMQRKQGALP